MTTIRLLCLIVLCLGVCPTPAAARDDLDCRVDDSLGRPLAGAHVSVFRSENQAFSTQSNAEGRFTIPDLGEENARIHVGKDGYTTAVESYWPDYDLRPTRYRLYEARSIIGRVLDENGQPLPAAGVIGFTEAGIDFSWPESDCDANGAFRLDGLPIGLVWVNAFLPGYEPVHSGPYSIETESIEIRLTPKPSGNFRFVAKEVGSGEPIEGVDVSLTLDPEVGSRYFRLPRRFATQSTNADGVALIEGLPAGNYHVSIDHSELTIQPNELHYEPLLAGETRTISLGDAPSDSETIDLQGRVLLDDEPLVGVEVHAHTSPVFQRGPSAVTDAEGRFLLTAPYVPGKPLYAGLAGREYSAILPDGLDNAVKLTSVEPDREVTIVAARSATVVVRATSTNGQPLAGVSATLEGGTHHGWSYPYVTWGETDDAGLLRLDGLAPSDPPARLQLSYGDEEQKWPNRLTWSEGETVEDIVVQFADKASISGIVRDETGRPYPGVWVFAGETTMTDRSGRFAISGLAAGKREAWLSIDEADDIHKAAYTLELEPGQEVDNLEWVLPRNAPDVIEGMVFTSNGQPVRSYSLHVDAGKDDARHVEGDESGFQITELSPGEHRIIAYVTEHDSPDRVLFANSEPVTARAGDTGIRLVIGDIPGSSVSGHLRVAGNGGQVQFMLTRADDDGHDGSLSVHLAPGDFQFPAVRAGSYEAWLWLGGHDSPELTFTVLPGEPTRLGEIFLDVIPPIRGRVLDESGRPISGAKVVRFDPRLLDFFGEQVPENAPTSDVDGRFEAKMDQDFWSTWLVKDGFAPVNIENLPKGSDLEIRLRHSGSILLENVPTEMEGWQTWHECLVPDSELGVYADQAGWISGMDDEPTRSFKDLPYGRWRIHLWKSDSDSSMSGPPDEPEPRVYLRFELEVRPGETTRFDLKSVW